MPSILADSVELRHLRYFRVLAESRSFTRAASAIGLTQSTLSHQIRRLELAVGAELFQRGRSACRLTAAGELLLPYAQRVLGDMDALRQALDDQSGLRRGTLRVGVLPALCHNVLPTALAEFHVAHPGIQVRVVEMSVDEMPQALKTGTVELCVGVVGSAQPVVRGELLFQEELVAVLRSDDAQATDGAVAVAEIAARPLVAPPAGYGTRTLILQAWSKVRRIPAFTLEIGSTEGIVEAVLRSGSVGILPASALWDRRPDGWVAARIVRPGMSRVVGVIRAPGGNRRPAAEALVRFLCRAIEPLLQSTVVPAECLRPIELPVA